MRSEKFGARLRKLYDAAIDSKNSRYECPKCHKKKVRRRSNAVWQCNSCDAKYAGGAYSFHTEVGEVAARLIGEYTKSNR